jgi:hypothetical protein
LRASSWSAIYCCCHHQQVRPSPYFHVIQFENITPVQRLVRSHHQWSLWASARRLGSRKHTSLLPSELLNPGHAHVSVAASILNFKWICAVTSVIIIWPNSRCFSLSTAFLHQPPYLSHIALWKYTT